MYVLFLSNSGTSRRSHNLVPTDFQIRRPTTHSLAEKLNSNFRSNQRNTDFGNSNKFKSNSQENNYSQPQVNSRFICNESADDNSSMQLCNPRAFPKSSFSSSESSELEFAVTESNKKEMKDFKPVGRGRSSLLGKYISKLL